MTLMDPWEARCRELRRGEAAGPVPVNGLADAMEVYEMTEVGELGVGKSRLAYEFSYFKNLR